MYYYLQDDSKAIEIYDYLLNKEDSSITDDARCNIYVKLACIHMHKRDYKLAAETFSKSTKLNVKLDAGILNTIGFVNEMSENFITAFQYYTLSSEKNYDYAHLNLAYMYEKGIYIEKDQDKASMYYQKGKDSLEEWRASRDKFSK